MAGVSKPKYTYNFNSSLALTEANQAQAKIKFCGYLKKKRNKMGGWRKLWFVLQDKLLVSYGSKEEYDNKLVSFKDVLNLVPGTIVRPLGGFRFTIETTSQAMFTFHCDDRVAYRKWITMLLYSLSTDNMPPTLEQNKSLTSSLAKQLSSISLGSCCLDAKFPANDGMGCVALIKQNSIIPIKTNHITSGVPLLPIGQKTAKILERNGIDPLKNLEFEANECQRVSPNRQQCSDQHFRLHNVPYDRSLSATELRSPKHFTLLQVPEKAHTVNLINRMFYAENRNKLTLKECDKTTARDFEKTSESKNGSGEDTVFTSNCKSGPAQESKTLDMIKDKIHHISVKGSKNLTVEITSDSMEKHTHKKLATNAIIEEVLTKKESQPLISKTIEESPYCGNTTDSRAEPVYASVDFKSKYANRKMRHSSNLGIKQRCNSYDSIIQQTYDEFPIQKQMQWKFENSQIKKPINPMRTESCIDNEIDLDEIEGIYEDSELFPKDDLSKLHTRDCEENIYEPINITNRQHNSIWTYFNRLKINSILHMTRIKKSSAECKYSKSAKPIPNGGQIFDFKNKNSASRKSIKVRMRKFCFREYEPKPFFKHNQQTICNNPQLPVAPIKKLKIKWKSVKLASKNQNVLSETGNKAEKRFFGSLPHLRKARISLFSNQHFQRNSETKAVKKRDTKESDTGNTEE